MAITSIQAWLATRGSYARGVELLKVHGNPSSADVFFFGLPESQAGRDRLVSALTALNNTATRQVESIRATRRPGPKEDDEVDGKAFARSLEEPPKNLPEGVLPVELRPLRRDLDRWWREMTMARGTMLSTPDGMELRRLVDRIAELDAKVKSGWVVIERWRRLGIVHRTDQPDKRVNVAELHMKRNRAMVWLSQRKHGHRKGSPEQVAAKEQELAEVNQLIEDARTAPIE